MAHDDALTRRQMFRMAAIGAAATAIGVQAGERGPREAAAQNPTTPQTALQALRDGNNRYATSLGGNNNNMISFGADLSLIRQHTENSQQPFAALLSCADSRVAPEIIFDATINQLFICRVAGNLATAENIASLEYAVAVVGTVKAIMVLGHGDCGAVAAAASSARVTGVMTQISALYAPLRPGIAIGGNTLDGQIRANARVQAALLSQASPVISDAIKNLQLLVVPAIYDVSSGRVTELPPIQSVTASP